MPFFRYKIILDGKNQEKVVEAITEKEASQKLWRQNVTIVKFLGESNTQDTTKKSLFLFKKRQRFNVYKFTDQLAPLLQSGIPLEQVLAIIEEGMDEKSGISVVQQLRRGLHEGRSFSELLKERETYFPPLFAILIETGEQTGCLPEVADELQRFMKESKEFKEFVITSSIYPAIILLVTVTMITLLFTFFIPRFSKLFKDTGKDLPFLTEIMLNTGNFMKSIWWIYPILILLLIIFYKKSKRGKLKTLKDKSFLCLPIIGKIVQDTQLSRFFRTLSIMVKNNVPILRAVNISSRILQNSIIAESFSEVTTDLKAGHNLSLALKSKYMISGTNSMLRISEESGDVASMLTSIAETGEREVKVQLKRLLTALEPAIIIMLALFIALVVLAVFQAIMQMNAL
ncbi:type II secretion system F family protein [Lentisphaerota bacterium WC36G]|nr:type II secretion system F family protein [Lentisphaerae bacterium WC36]